MHRWPLAQLADLPAEALASYETEYLPHPSHKPVYDAMLAEYRTLTAEMTPIFRRSA